MRAFQIDDMLANRTILIKRDAMEDFSKHMSAEYEKQSGIQMTPLLCQIVDGAG